MITSNSKDDTGILTEICYSIADVFDSTSFYKDGFDTHGPYWREQADILNTPMDIISLISMSLEGLEVETELYEKALEKLYICNKWLNGAFVKTICLLDEFIKKEVEG